MRQNMEMFKWSNIWLWLYCRCLTRTSSAVAVAAALDVAVGVAVAFADVAGEKKPTGSNKIFEILNERLF